MTERWGVKGWWLQSREGGVPLAMATTMGTNKVYILDKYFNELQKFWDTEKRLQGEQSVPRPC